VIAKGGFDWGGSGLPISGGVTQFAILRVIVK